LQALSATIDNVRWCYEKIGDTTPTKPHINSKLIGGLVSALLLICASSFASGQRESIGSLTASRKVKVETSGTGETIGHVADLKLQNLTDEPLTCAMPPMILESASGKTQNYPCPRW